MKAIKIRIYPNKFQSVLINKHFGCCRFVYNFALQKSNEFYQQNQKHLSSFNIITMLPELKEEKEWLKEVHSQALQQTIRDVDSAFSHFFKRNNKFPKFKSKNNPKQSYRLPQGFKINREKKYISIPKLGWIRFRDEFKIPEEVEFRNITILRDIDEYYVSICYKTNEQPKEKYIPELDKTLGIDLGIKTLVTFSNGAKIENPKHLMKYENQLEKEQRRLSKKQNKNLKSYQKQKRIVGNIHKKVKNIRKDFLHKLTTNIVENQDYTSVAIEDLAVQEMMVDNFSSVSKAIGDVGWRMLRQMLEYKTKDRGKNLFVIGRFEPSSKLCVCGVKNETLTLEEREWVCKNCGEKHDRDILAARNIKMFGYRKYEAGQVSATKELQEPSLL